MTGFDFTIICSILYIITQISTYVGISWWFIAIFVIEFWFGVFLMSFKEALTLVGLAALRPWCFACYGGY